MALHEQKALAIALRKEGASYSEIKERIQVSKSTLSLWLRDMPLSRERLVELRDYSSIRIEKYRATMSAKKGRRLDAVRRKVRADIGKLSKRELLIAGLFLYWGEGTKTSPCVTSVSNTDPEVLKFFIRWLGVLGVSEDKLRVHVHLYVDMNVEQELEYWSRTLKLPRTSFRKPYVKSSKQSGLSYPQRFTHGTCNVIYGNRDIAEYVSIALDCIRESVVADGPEV